KSDAQLREEARLAYVACTRAADRLIITRARKRNRRNTTVSPFFASLPDNVRQQSQGVIDAGPTTLPRLSTPSDPSVAADADLRRRLRVVRDVIARTNFTLPEAVLSDAELSRIVADKPRNMDDLSRILGPLTATRLGAAILREVGATA
ncbi:MAG: HRDC domain-containing protein, partial [Actinomycetota bacterium]